MLLLFSRDACDCRCNRSSRHSTPRVLEGNIERAPAGIEDEGERPDRAALTSSNKIPGSVASSSRRTSARSRSGTSDSFSSCDSECSHVTVEDLPGQNASARLQQKKRPKRHVFRGDGVEISWLSPRPGRTSRHSQEAKEPAVQEATQAPKLIEAADAATQGVQADAATATDQVASPEAAPAAPVAAPGSPTASCALGEIVARAEQVLAAQRQEPPQESETSLLKDIFLCLHAALKETYEEQQNLGRRQHQLEQWLQQQQHEREEAVAQQQAATKAAIAQDKKAAKEWANRVGPSLLGLRECGKVIDAAAAAFPDAASVTSKGDLPPVPPHPWHVAGRTTAADTSTAPSSTSGIDTIWWRHWAGKQTKPPTGTQPDTHEQKTQQLPADHVSYVPSWGGSLNHQRHLPLAPLPAVSAADVNKVMLRARQKAGNMRTDAQLHADQRNKEMQQQMPLAFVSAQLPYAATRRWKLKQFFSSDTPKPNPDTIK